MYGLSGHVTVTCQVCWVLLPFMGCHLSPPLFCCPLGGSFTSSSFLKSSSNLSCS